MIATHAPKMFNSRLKQSAIMARLPVTPPTLVCSSSTKMEKEFWSTPTNAAEIRKFREEAGSFCDSNFVPNLPDIEDSKIKQLLIPLKGWRNNDYLSVTPVASMGMFYEIFNRLKHPDYPPSRIWNLQPNPSALANHGDAILQTKGKVKLLTRGIKKQRLGRWKGDFVQLTARVESMNISSGMVSIGFPAITAIGGMVHALERKTGADIDFAVGFDSIKWNDGISRNVGYKGPTGITTNRTASKSKIKPVPVYSTEEITGSGNIALLLRSDSDLEDIKNELLKMHRFAGGNLFDVEVNVLKNSKPPQYAYLIDDSISLKKELISTRKGEFSDSLQSALNLYRKGRWADFGNKRYFLSDSTNTLIQSGYALLEEPKLKRHSRNNYKHAWSEPVFSLTKLSFMSNRAWWTRNYSYSVIYWGNNG